MYIFIHQHCGNNSTFFRMLIVFPTHSLGGTTKRALIPPKEPCILHIDGTASHLRRAATPTAHSLQRFLCCPAHLVWGTTRATFCGEGPVFYQKSPVLCEKSPTFCEKSPTFREKRVTIPPKDPVFCILMARKLTSEERRLQQRIFYNASCVAPRVLCGAQRKRDRKPNVWRLSGISEASARAADR